MISDLSLINILNAQGVKGAVVKNGVLKTCTTVPNSLTIPKGIRRLETHALAGHNNLGHLIISDTVESVGNFVLVNCPNLRLIECHTNLKSYEELLRYGNLSEVSYVYSRR